jgi:hypothetical protein
MKRGFLVLFIFLLSNLSWAQLSMKVNAPTISLNDTLTLTLTSTNPQTQGQPNISLLDKDFNVISTEHRVNYNFINGVAQSNNEWTYVLFPKHAGTITIPPLSIGREVATSGITVVITTASSETSSQPAQNTQVDTPQDVFIKTSAKAKTAYVNAQILYTVKVFNRRQLIDVVYTPPEAANALVLPLEQAKHYQTVLDGNVYAVEELQYAIFPNQSGVLTIQPPQLKAIMYDLLPEHIQIKGQTLQMNVKPAPTHIKSFLPALNLNITEQFDLKDTQLSQGATLTRTIILHAVGVPASLLPTLNFSGKGFSTYPSPPELKNEQSTQGIVGKSSTRITYLFNTPGDHTLPGIEVPWFNTQTQKTETATLPPHTFTIIADKIEAHTTTIPQPTELNTVFGFSNPVTIWMISTLVLVLILLALFIKRFLSRPLLTKQTEMKENPAHLSTRHIRQQLKQACHHHDKKEAAQALLQWASIKWPSDQFLHLKQITAHCHDSALAQEIDHLTEALYRQMDLQPWKGEPLWEAFEHYTNEKHHEPKSNKKRLPELNPR